MTNTGVYSLSEKIIDSPSFQKKFVAIQVYSSRKRLVLEVGPFKRSNLNTLLLQGSVLALSDNVQHKAISQKINALAHESWPNEQTISHAVQILSSRIGNYPVISSAFKIFGQLNLIDEMNSDNSNSSLQVDLETRTNLAFEEHQSRFVIKKRVFHFNLYQKEVLLALERKSLISFSAPTSFGKSFVVRHHIARLFAAKKIKRALIIVPTKSLIDDFYDSIVDLKSRLNLNFGIYTHSRSLTNVSEEAVFILTQERLIFMIAKSPEFIASFDLVYCDEAHYISRGYRGFVLRSALLQVIEICGIKGKSGGTQYIFSSPLIKNPEYYKDYFFSELSKKLLFHKEIKYSPVEKNIHFIVKNSADYNLCLFKHELRDETFEERLLLLGGKRYIRRKTNSNEVSRDVDMDIRVVVDINIPNQTILYVPSPRSAYEYATALYSYSAEVDLITAEELRDLESYITVHYDDSFSLIEFVKRGIGLHYGKMPVGLRRAMVDLFERGLIKYLICTSTLLEGVNLPAKNIFLFSTNQGGEPHNSLSFWNLIGRAGRITYGLSGNVFCVSKDAYQYKELFDQKESEIKDPEEGVAENKTRRKHVVSSILDPNKKFGYVTARNRDDIEYLIYELFVSSRAQDISKRLWMEEDEELQFLEIIQREKSSFVISEAMLKKNPGIDPRQQNELLISANELSLSELKSIFLSISSPLAVKKEHLVPLLQSTSSSFHWPIQGKYNKVDQAAGRISQWLHENSISLFIKQSLKWRTNDTFIMTVEAALKAVDFLDKELSYNAPKYLKCLLDIYLESARLRGLSKIDAHSERVESFLYAIESGISKFVSRFLFEIGVSRPIAIRASEILKDFTKRPVTKEFFQRKDVLNALQGGLSHIAYKELVSHLESYR